MKPKKQTKKLFDKTQLYIDKLEPVMDTVFKFCHAHGISCVCAFNVKQDEEGSTTAGGHVVASGAWPNEFAVSAMLLKDSVFSEALKKFEETQDLIIERRRVEKQLRKQAQKN